MAVVEYTKSGGMIVRFAMNPNRPEQERDFMSSWIAGSSTCRRAWRKYASNHRKRFNKAQRLAKELARLDVENGADFSKFRNTCEREGRKTG